MSTTQPAAGRAAGGGAVAGPVQRRLGLALVVIATAQLMVVLDATIVNVALPDIQKALGFSGTGLEWVVNAYALTFGGLLLLGGRAGDILGRRRVFIAGIILFSLASLAGGFATTQAWLLAARAIQGVGAAVIAPTALSLIATTFPEGPPRNRAMGVYAAMSIGGAAVGLMAGGLLTTYLSWRWVLFVNVPIGIAVALIAPRALAESPRRRGRFDLPGAVTSTLGLVALVYGLTSAATSPNGVSHWGDTKVIVSLTAAVVLLAAFVVIESRSEHALMPLRIFRNRDRSAANLIMLCVGTAMFGMFFFLTDLRADRLGIQRAEDRDRLPAASGRDHGDGRGERRAGPPDRRPAAAAGRLGGQRRRHVLAVPHHRAQHVCRRAARPDAGHRGRPGHAVHAADPGGPVPGQRPGCRPGLQPAQCRPAGRRLDRAGAAGHRGLDRGGQHGSQVGGCRHGRRQGRPPAAGTAAQIKAAIYDHALSVGFARGFVVSAGIMLIALIVTIAAIRVKRADLAGAQPTLTSPAGDEANAEMVQAG